MEGRREPKVEPPPGLERMLSELEESIGKRLSELLGEASLHYTVTVKADVDSEGIRRLAVEVEAVRPGVEDLRDIVDAIIQEEVRRFEQRYILRKKVKGDR
ncbi:MAG: hypothetical protein F7B20_06970 [Aeropyrum sp.]|nr:hypothetical protein [Aeropyrum sp.]MCE4616099.1 hypothetical protein [Aeropyrum sp.]